MDAISWLLFAVTTNALSQVPLRLRLCLKTEFRGISIIEISVFGVTSYLKEEIFRWRFADIFVSSSLIKYAERWDILCERRNGGISLRCHAHRRYNTCTLTRACVGRIGARYCSPRFANSFADHDRRHVFVELSKYLARLPTEC